MAIVAGSVAMLAQPVWAQGARVEPAGGQPPVGSVAAVASLDADAIVALQVRGALALQQSLTDEGCEVALRTGDVDDPIPRLLQIRDRYGNREDLLRRLTQGFGHDAARIIERLIGGVG